MKKGDTVYVVNNEARQGTDRQPKPCEVIKVGPRYVTVQYNFATIRFDKEIIRNGMCRTIYYSLYDSVETYNDYLEAQRRTSALQQRLTSRPTLPLWKLREMMRIMELPPDFGL